MDGNKKIIVLFSYLVIVGASISCSVQKTNYVHLYVDQPDSVSQDPSFLKIDSSPIKERTVVDYSPKQAFKSASNATTCCLEHQNDSLMHKELLRRLSEISHSEKLLHIKLDSIQDILSAYLDSVHSKHESQPTLHQPDNQTINKPDTVFIERMVTQREVIESKQEFADEIRNEKGAIIDTIVILQTQSSAQPKTLSKTDTIYLEKSIPASTETSLNRIDVAAYKNEIASKNDTIQILRNQLYAKPKTLAKTDTLYIEKPINATFKPALDQDNATDAIRKELNEKNERIIQLERQIEALQKSLITKETYPKSEKPEEYLILDTDTVSLTAFYELSKTVPKNQVLDSLINILETKEVLRLELSGYTDSSGDPKFNKQLTRARLDFIASEISSFELKEKIFLQNFGESFASEESIAEERKIEITIYIKPE
ncbi:MAG: hypothetical protein WEC59_13020 [Salibacteraceae bacterium]